MKVTAEQLVSFVAEHGDEFGVTMNDVNIVGIDNCIEWALICNAAYKPNATMHDILSCYFSCNFKCHLSEATARNNAEYTIYVAEYDGSFDYEPMGGCTVYCNSYDEMQANIEQLQNESDISYIVHDKNGNRVA